nr:hypothetical protein [Rhodococcus spelaei]
MPDNPSVLFVCVHNAGRSPDGRRIPVAPRRGIEAVRPIRDQMRERVEALIAELVPAHT